MIEVIVEDKQEINNEEIFLRVFLKGISKHIEDDTQRDIFVKLMTEELTKGTSINKGEQNV